MNSYSQLITATGTAAALLLVGETGPPLLAKGLVILGDDLVQSELLPVGQVVVLALVVRLAGYLLRDLGPVGAVLSQSFAQLFELLVGPLPADRIGLVRAVSAA